MIRFSFDSNEEDHSFDHFSIEGDNRRGYLLLAWNKNIRKGETDRETFQKWFETLGGAMSYCVQNFSILKDRWHAPTSAPPPARFESMRRKAREARLDTSQDDTATAD